jgi:prepilin-type processing-associated H-X9-DG protein
VENWEWLAPLGANYSAGVWGYGGYAPVSVYIVSATYGYATGGNTPAAQDLGKQGYHNRANGRGVCNWAFADGHVEAMNWKQTVMPRNLWRVEPEGQAVAYNPGPQYFAP